MRETFFTTYENREVQGKHSLRIVTMLVAANNTDNMFVHSQNQHIQRKNVIANMLFLLISLKFLGFILILLDIIIVLKTI
jgi:hypothetical protein